jgi:hypothetical protein
MYHCRTVFRINYRSEFLGTLNVSNVGCAGGCNVVNVISGDMVAGQTVGCKERTCQRTTAKKMKKKDYG